MAFGKYVWRLFFFGAELYRRFGEEIYSLALSNYKGEYSPEFWRKETFNTTLPVKKAGEHSLEHFFYSQHNDHPTFVPLPQVVQGRPSGHPWFSAKLFDLNMEARMDYTSSFDGIIVIPTTFGLTGKDKQE